eukprot:TRINITY_DN3657_c0_g1_i2.p1 TRINITY_DN3657_c0_g1~~TRINITY_DN3657_c0_g1_i2.p1  ORF type:complete len:501 (-),score=150.16 TRINITY_DN3657_c0_g1_i2:982-2433(-)
MGAQKHSFEAAVNAVRLLVQEKIQIGRKTDMLGMVLFGAAATKNNLADDDGSYKHVVEDVSLGQVDLNFLRKLDKITPGNKDADFVDALVVSLDMLFHKTAGKKYDRRVYLLTDAGSNINGQDDLPVIVSRMKELETKLNIIGVDFELDEDGNVLAARPGRSVTKVQNETLLKQISDDVGGQVFNVTDAIEIMAIFKKKSVLQRPLWKGSLNVAGVTIPVTSFVKTAEAKFPSLKRMTAEQAAAVTSSGGSGGTGAGGAAHGASDDDAGDAIDEDEGGAEGGVMLQRKYMLVDEPNGVPVGEDNRVKAFRYGKNIIPFQKVDEASIAIESEKCMEVIGFVPKAKVPRCHYLGGCSTFLGDPNDDVACKAISHLVQALASVDKVAIVRYVYRAGLNPKVGVLIPHRNKNYDGFLFYQLPYADDLRGYSFPSLDNKKTPISAEQLAAADALIDAMDLSQAALDEDGYVYNLSDICVFFLFPPLDK